MQKMSGTGRNTNPSGSVGGRRRDERQRLLETEKRRISPSSELQLSNFVCAGPCLIKMVRTLHNGLRINWGVLYEPMAGLFLLRADMCRLSAFLQCPTMQKEK